MTNKILLVEDDMSISEMISEHLKKDGFDVICAFDGQEGISKFREGKFDLVLLDIMMPKLDGIELMKIIRSINLLPILIMSAKDSDVDKAIGLGFGADDYITKPFSMIELTARVKALIRRANRYSNVKEINDNNIIKKGNLEIDLDNYSVKKNNKTINLTSKEFEILKIFMKNPKRVFTKSQIYSFVWEEEYYNDVNVINVHIRRLREKIEDNASDPKYIKTIWGIGYKLGEF
ncbi:response regulator transcription factor [Clostridiaceae bacterium M8S5]|nr:response regulator transcription factor [Clostridiaceae bacterium M8S5]